MSIWRRWATRDVTLPQSRVGLIILLGCMCALGAVSVDIYLPSLPDVATDLNTSAATAQLTITASLVGGGIGQLLVGPLSDLYGRRIPVLIGLLFHVAASIGISLSHSITLLIGLRVVMGVANTSAAVVSTAVVRDLYSGSQAARLLSQLMLVIGVAPLFAPAAGTWLAAVGGGWRFVFVCLAGLGAALWLLVLLRLPDTRPPAVRAGAKSLRQVFGSFGRILKTDRGFLPLAVFPPVGNGVLMSWVIFSPFLVREVYGLQAWHFAVVFAGGGTALVLGAQLNAALVRRFRPVVLLRSAVPVQVLIAGAMLALALLAVGGLPGLLTTMFAILFLGGLTSSNATALAISRHG
ncbi:MAG: Bcr/CflA family efflux MFS transporter, partial [Bifidobacteriaceae bacterium]|nr:Bcr/CflA family efflux MFS transporter [Bifidobacteriaceae bacterium]